MLWRRSLLVSLLVRLVAGLRLGLLRIGRRVVLRMLLVRTRWEHVLVHLRLRVLRGRRVRVVPG